MRCINRSDNAPARLMSVLLRYEYASLSSGGDVDARKSHKYNFGFVRFPALMYLSGLRKPKDDFRCASGTSETWIREKIVLSSNPVPAVPGLEPTVLGSCTNSLRPTSKPHQSPTFLDSQPESLIAMADRL